MGRRALLEAGRMGKASNYNRMVNNLSNEIDWDMDPETLPVCLDKKCSDWVNERRQEKKSCHLIQKTNYLVPVRKSRFLDMSELSMAYHEFLTYNSGLGNRYPICDAGTIKMCPWCFEKGFDNALSEPHFLFSCQSIDDHRRRSELSAYIGTRPSLNEDKLYKDFWTGRVSDNDMRERVIVAKQLKAVFLETMMGVLTGL